MIASTLHPAVARARDALRAGPGHPLFLIDDEENVLEAARAGVSLEGLFVSGPDEPSADLSRLADHERLSMHVLAPPVAKALFRTEKRSRVFALARAPRASTLDDFSGRAGDIVVLDGVRLAGNIGAIVRSASALGAAGLVLLNSGLDSALDRRIVRASRGLVFSTPVVLSHNSELAYYLERRGIPLVGLMPDAPSPLTSIAHAPRPVAILMGSERHGPSGAMAARVERNYSIPMGPQVESLNVSVATALALYERLPPSP
jgi:TrmH family RNA methyltransferase